ncbi:MAG: hypothetical protein O7F12_09555 [Nitrospirae bacterium]|nr:hypothetical protein [Nitrospirota bacterium]
MSSRFLSVVMTYCLFTVLGCAGIVMDKRDVLVRVHTIPTGATLIVAGNEFQSPANLWLPRGEGDISLGIYKDGYRPEQVIFRESLEPRLWWNVFNVGLGLGVDFINGAAYDLYPKEVNVTLVKE